MSWTSRAAKEAAAIRAAGRWRTITDLDARGPRARLPGGREVVSFASNDYLGLTIHPAVVAAAHAALDRWGAGAGAARLIVGSRPVHRELEDELADWKKTEAALLFPNGFVANLGVLTTLGGPNTLICSDELNHASIVDGCRAAKARVEIYPHCDLAALERLLSSAASAIVVSDAVFSMDGDTAPVADLVEICAAHGALLVLDEAHAVLGPEVVPGDAEVLRVGTLSKFLGALGGFVAGPSELVALLVNRARSFIFTTALSPADAAAALAALRVLRSSEGDELRRRLRTWIDLISPGHPSPIIPFVLGTEEAAATASEALLERGYLVPAIRPPSVAPGTARLRVTVSAAHTKEDIDGFTSALETIGGLSG